MNILILHLSDMHFGNKKNYSKENIVAIVSALQQSMARIDHVLIIVSGDLSYSGKKAECIYVDRFLNSLKNAITKRYKVQDIRFAVVPGNHDIDYRKGDLGRAGLECIERENSYSAALQKELEKQTQFFILSNRYDCFPRRDLLHQKTMNYGDKKIQLNLINTAVFSSIDEDQGFHYLGEREIAALSGQKNSDFVITVMHHPHHWYSSHCKKALEEAIYSRSDIILVGHEHYESSMKIEQDDTSVNLFSAGKLSDRGDWTNSEFRVAVLNLETREYITKKYIWNGMADIYEENGSKTVVLSKDRYNQLGLIVRPEFSRMMEEDKYLISRSIRDYFVFPLLVEEHLGEDKGKLPREIDSLEGFIGILGIKDKIVISGGSDTGKSILAKVIYAELAKNRVVLFINGADVGPNPERTIREAFEDTYSNDKTKFEAFKQAKPEELAIVIDDVDAIEVSREDGFISYISEHFGVIIETCQADIDIDIKSRLKKRAINRDFSFFRIALFYAPKRKQLVSNIVNQISNADMDAKEHIIASLCDVLTKQKYLYSWNPEFIVQFVKYYCNNIGEAMQNDGSVFSKVFEANLTQLIKPYARNMTVDKIMIVLDKIAYRIYIDKSYPVSLSIIDSCIQQYNKEFGSKLDTMDFLTLLMDAKIMKKAETEGYIFYDRNYLAYFTAREIKRHCLEEGDFEQFNHIMEYSYSGLNADILLFVTYITDNINIIRMVIEQAVRSVSEWTEFNFREIDIPFLINPVDQVVKPFEEEDRKKAEEDRIQQEKAEVQAVTIANDETIIHGENEELNFVQKVMRSISLMIILARTLPCFEHMMKLEDKEKCVDMLYRMPLCIFEAWAKETDHMSGELISEIKSFHECEFRREKAEIPPLEDNQALNILKWEATSLLLDLMYAAMNNATKSNTNDFIDRFDYKASPSYGIEHLIGLMRRDSVKQFSSEAERIFEEEKHPLTKAVVQRITRRFMINSKRIKPQEIQRLKTKIFADSIQQSRLLVEKGRNRRKN